jgi:hypothetical protein
VRGHIVLIRFVSNYTDFERRLGCLKALLNASSHDFFKKEFADEGNFIIL